MDVPSLTCWGGDDRCFATYTWHGCTRFASSWEGGGIERDNPFTCAAFAATWSGAFFHNSRKCRPSTARLTPRVVSALSSRPERLFSPRNDESRTRGIKGDKRDDCCQQFYVTSVVRVLLWSRVLRSDVFFYSCCCRFAKRGFPRDSIATTDCKYLCLLVFNSFDLCYDFRNQFQNLNKEFCIKWKFLWLWGERDFAEIARRYVSESLYAGRNRLNERSMDIRAETCVASRFCDTEWLCDQVSSSLVYVYNLSYVTRRNF